MVRLGRGAGGGRAAGRRGTAAALAAAAAPAFFRLELQLTHGVGGDCRADSVPLRRRGAAGQDSRRPWSGGTSGQSAAGGGSGGGLPVVLLLEVESVLECPRAEVSEENRAATLRVDPTELGLVRVRVRVKGEGEGEGWGWGWG